jgi:integrase
MTGLRIVDLLALRWQDIESQGDLLSVRQTVQEGHFDEPKTRRSKRRIPLGPKCVEILAAYSRLREDAGEMSHRYLAVAGPLHRTLNCCLMSFQLGMHLGLNAEKPCNRAALEARDAVESQGPG